MTLTNSQALKVQPLRGQLDVGLRAAALEGTAVALEGRYDGPATHWTDSDDAEGLTGAVAVAGVDMDLESGLVYAGPVGAHLNIAFTNVDVRGSLGGAPEAADTLNIGVYRNNDLVGSSDEGFVAEFDTATAEFNGTVEVDNMQTGDVIRFALMTGEGSEDSLLVDLVEGGEILIS
jgi:hypothetical protein